MIIFYLTEEMKKHVGLLEKTRTCFRKKTYMLLLYTAH